MDGERFDAVTGMLEQTHGRRGALRLLGGALAAVALGRADIGEAKKKGGRKTGKKDGNQLECELLGGTYRKRVDGGFSCEYKGFHVICDLFGTCIRICVVGEGCDCQNHPTSFCDAGKPVSEPAGPEAPIADEVKPTTGSGGGRPGRPGQGAAAGGGGTVKK